MLMIWLVGTGLGSLAGGRILGDSPGKISCCALPLGMAFMLLGSICILRCCPSWLGYSWGEILSLPSWAAIAIGALFPLCFISGILFPLLGQLAKRFSSPLQSLLGVYQTEALGAAVGGALGLFLITWVDGIPLALLINSGLAGCAFWFWKAHPQRRPNDKWAFILLIMVPLFILLALGTGKILDQKSREIQWQPFSLKKVQETPFGNLALAERTGQFDFFLNGIFQFSSPDPRRAEEKTHLPLLIHPEPRTIFLIGGGLSGSLREILKHPMIQSVDYVELDPDWVKSVCQILPELRSLIKSNPKTHLLLGDGRRILMKRGKCYDLILLDLPGPVSLQLNRFYTQEFFQTAKDHLNPGGILVLVLNGPADMIGVSQSETFKSLYDTLKTVFPGTTLFPGEEITLLGFRNEPDPGISPALILSRLKERSISLHYLNPLQIQTILSPWRTHYFQKVFNHGRPGEANRDLKPVSFFNQVRSDLASQNPWLAACLQGFRTIPVSFLIGFPLLPWAILLVWIKFFPGVRPGLTVLTSIGVSGFSAMAVEIMVLVLFQINLGILYLEIGLLIALFMLGLAGGPFFINFIERHSLPLRLIIVGLQVMISAFFLLLIGLAKGMGEWPEGILKLFFYFSMAFSGGLCGAIYALCSKAYFLLRKGISRTAGTLYGLDLLGASLASLGIPLFLLPLWGMTWTLTFLFLLNSLTATLLAKSNNLFLDKR
jgi:spermidine synthase